MTFRVAARASHVALGNLSLDRCPRRSRTAEIEPLVGAGPMVEVQSSLGRAAVQAPALPLVGVKPFAALAHVAVTCSASTDAQAAPGACCSTG